MLLLGQCIYCACVSKISGHVPWMLIFLNPKRMSEFTVFLPTDRKCTLNLFAVVRGSLVLACFLDSLTLKGPMGSLYTLLCLTPDDLLVNVDPLGLQGLKTVWI